MSLRRVVITGLGAVSPLGQGMAETWEGLVSETSAIKPLVRRVGDHVYEGPAAVVQSLKTTELEKRFGPRVMAHLDPFSSFAVVAAYEAFTEAGLLDHPVRNHGTAGPGTAIVWGCGSGGNQTIEDSYARVFLQNAKTVHPMTIPKQMISAPPSHISMILGIEGPAFTLASACASSGHAIGEGFWMVRSGRADVALVGGSEAALTLSSWLGWLALKAMADDTCRPFSINRKGMVLGEGAAALVLEDYDHAKARGANIVAELLGYGASSDAHHITMPHGRGAEAALRAAHRDAKLPLETPVLISSHGTGTSLNDKIEAAAIGAVYGEHLSQNRIMATKSSHGHLIGGAGALELVTGLLCLNKGIVPGIRNSLGEDPECRGPFVWQNEACHHEVLVSNSFAFGGLNAVLIARKFSS